MTTVFGANPAASSGAAIAGLVPVTAFVLFTMMRCARKEPSHHHQAGKPRGILRKNQRYRPERGFREKVAVFLFAMVQYMRGRGVTWNECLTETKTSYSREEMDNYYKESHPDWDLDRWEQKGNYVIGLLDDLLEHWESRMHHLSPELQAYLLRSINAIIVDCPTEEEVIALSAKCDREYNEYQVAINRNLTVKKKVGFEPKITIGLVPVAIFVLFTMMRCVRRWYNCCRPAFEIVCNSLNGTRKEPSHHHQAVPTENDDIMFDTAESTTTQVHTADLDAVVPPEESATTQVHPADLDAVVPPANNDVAFLAAESEATQVRPADLDADVPTTDGDVVFDSAPEPIQVQPAAMFHGVTETHNTRPTLTAESALRGQQSGHLPDSALRGRGDHHPSTPTDDSFIYTSNTGVASESHAIKQPRRKRIPSFKKELEVSPSLYWSNVPARRDRKRTSFYRP